MRISHLCGLTLTHYAILTHTLMGVLWSMVCTIYITYFPTLSYITYIHTYWNAHPILNEISLPQFLSVWALWYWILSPQCMKLCNTWYVQCSEMFTSRWLLKRWFARATSKVAKSCRDKYSNTTLSKKKVEDRVISEQVVSIAKTGLCMLLDVVHHPSKWWWWCFHDHSCHLLAATLCLSVHRLSYVDVRVELNQV